MKWATLLLSTRATPDPQFRPFHRGHISGHIQDTNCAERVVLGHFLSNPEFPKPPVLSGFVTVWPEDVGG